MNEEEKNKKKNHGFAGYLLLNAIWRHYPRVQFGLVEISANGFSCEVDVGQPRISENDFEQLESTMAQLLKTASPSLRDLPFQDALDWAEKNNQIYLLDHLKNNRRERVWLYRQQEFETIFDPPVVEGKFTDKTPDLVFKIIAIGGVYWQNDNKNKQLQRLQVVVFERQEDLQNFLKQADEQMQSDHRVIGKNQNLFVFSDLVGQGLPLWLEDGATIKRQLENYILNEEIKRGYSHVVTPDIASLKLYETSGHYPYYKDSMYAPIDIDGRQFMLRPMTCPHHFQIYKNKPHSYKELPIRYAELAKLYRHEQSGELSGLVRVRTFTLADAHIICRADQVNAEIEGALQLIEDVSTVFGLVKNQDYFYRLSLGDRGDQQKYYDDATAWDEAESKLRNVLKNRQDEFKEVQGEAAFYGPKIDIQMLNNNGKEETAFTVQYDFVMPKRFQLTYVDSRQATQEAIVIHRSSIGAVERLLAFLIEFYGGKFPIWLSPCQIKILTVNPQEQLIDYAKKLREEALEHAVRVKLDLDDVSVSKKIKQAKQEAVPYIIVLGTRELEQQQFKLDIRSDLTESVLSGERTYQWLDVLKGVMAANDSKR